MTFQLVVNHRVAEKANTLDEAVRQADRYLAQSATAHIEIVDLNGGIYRDCEVKNLINELS